jgi:hypothetical protein
VSTERSERRSTLGWINATGHCCQSDRRSLVPDAIFVSMQTMRRSAHLDPRQTAAQPRIAKSAEDI